MIDIVFKTAGAIIVLNIIILLTPDGRFEKYVSFISGLVILAVMIGSFKNITLPDNNIFSDYEITFQNKTLENEIFLQTKATLEQKFMEYVDMKYKGSVKKVKVDFDGEIKNVEIYLATSTYIEDVGNFAAEFFQTDKSKIVLIKDNM